MTTESTSARPGPHGFDPGFGGQHDISSTSGRLDFDPFREERDEYPTSEIPVIQVDEEQPADEADSFRVRPYARTGGRTRSKIDLAIETIVTSREHAVDSSRLSSAEHHVISKLCLQPHSVAEVAAKLRLPLGVVRVLLSDMSGLSLIEVHSNGELSSNGRPPIDLMERVLAGLRRM
jgi:hypothetical protein